MIILGIECSHDDISIAILENSVIVYLDTLTQTELHKKYGGTVPELASREHVSATAIILERIKKKYDLNKIDYVAYTEKPGLIGSLQVGFLFSNAIAIALSKKLIPINHLHGHFFSASINYEFEFPVLGLIVSGGHTQIIFAKTSDKLDVVGETLDDAVGELYDKVGRKLGLDYPGGKEIDNLAKKSNGKMNYKFKVPITSGRFDLSFSGFKTQALRIIENEGKELDIVNFCASFQFEVVNYLEKIFVEAINFYKPKSICLSGGVSANSLLRRRFKFLHKKSLIPKLVYTNDNGAMIAKAAEVILEKKAKNVKITN